MSGVRRVRYPMTCPRRTEVVVSVPERGGDKEQRLLPDFEVFGTASIAILSELSGNSGLGTESAGCDVEVLSRVPLWPLGQPDINPG